MADRKRMGWAPAAKSRRIYELEVFLVGGNITRQFAKENRVVSRTILIRGDQTLKQLHDVIFRAFGRWEQHMYEFQVGGKGPMDPKARCYVLSGAGDELYETKKPAGTVAGTTLDDIGLKKGEAFGYWFDFGDDWWHQINVVAMREEAGSGKYPRVTAKVGESPPQYPDLDDEEGDEEEDEDEE